MPDKVYCYSNSDVLINKLNIQDGRDLFEAEKELTYIRLKELQDNPIKGGLNALHSFREGNGRTQREFTRLVCSQCGYAFELSVTTHEEMLKASKLSFDKCDNSLLCSIFSRAVVPKHLYLSMDDNCLKILTSDDLTIEDTNDGYDYYSYEEYNHIQFYNEVYQEKINEMQEEGGIVNG